MKSDVKVAIPHILGLYEEMNATFLVASEIIGHTPFCPDTGSKSKYTASYQRFNITDCRNNLFSCVAVHLQKLTESIFDP